MFYTLMGATLWYNFKQSTHVHCCWNLPQGIKKKWVTISIFMWNVCRLSRVDIFINKYWTLKNKLN